MPTAIFYITDKGLRLAERLKGLYHDARIERFDPGSVSALWRDYKGFIFIMATGIVVRTIAPLLEDKRTDPAVVVVDETGRFAISLLSGHIGGANRIAKEIADFLGGEAVITTASDVNNHTSTDLWARENNLVVEDWKVLPQIGTRLLNKGLLRTYLDEIELKLPYDFLRVSEPEIADIIVTNKRDIYGISTKTPKKSGLSNSGFPGRSEVQLYLRPRDLVIGIGCNSGTSEEEIDKAVRASLEAHNLSFFSINSIASIDIKSKEEGLINFAKRYGFQVRFFSAEELNLVKGVTKSQVVFEATGAYGVSESAALLASGASELLIPKQKLGNVTVAVARMNKGITKKKGRLYIVGTGPGSLGHITPHAREVIRNSDVIVGYGTYLDLIGELIKDKEVISTGMTQEVERCIKAIELAMSGKTVTIISGGDPGIYAMAGLVFEILYRQRQSDVSKIDLEVIPGVSALNACAALLGAPLMHDFVVISLSDRLTEWELIEQRLEYAAKVDFVTVLYNPRSRSRSDYIDRARDIFLRYKSPETPVGIVRSAMRRDEKIIITSLKDLPVDEIDMQTTVIIGNSKTFVFDKWMITPRGYSNKYDL